MNYYKTIPSAKHPTRLPGIQLHRQTGFKHEQTGCAGRKKPPQKHPIHPFSIMAWHFGWGWFRYPQQTHRRRGHK